MVYCIILLALHYLHVDLLLIVIIHVLSLPDDSKTTSPSPHPTASSTAVEERSLSPSLRVRTVKVRFLFRPLTNLSFRTITLLSSFNVSICMYIWVVSNTFCLNLTLLFLVGFLSGFTDFAVFPFLLS